MQTALYRYFLSPGSDCVFPNDGFGYSFITAMIVIVCFFLPLMYALMSLKPGRKSLFRSLCIVGGAVAVTMSLVCIWSEQTAKVKTSAFMSALSDPNAAIGNVGRDAQGQVTAVLIIENPSTRVDILGKSVLVPPMPAKRFILYPDLIELLQANHATLAGKPFPNNNTIAKE